MSEHADLRMAKLYMRCAQKAKERGKEFSLSFAQYKKLRQTKRCHYLGIELTEPTEGSAKATAWTLDRVDPSQGYLPRNVVACCYVANNVKAQWEKADGGASFMNADAVRKILEKCP